MKALYVVLAVLTMLSFSKTATAQKSIGVMGGIIKPNILIGNKSDSRNYDEETFWKAQFGAQLFVKKGNKRRLLSLQYLSRSYHLSSYNLQSFKDWHVDMKHFQIKYKIGRYLFNGKNFYIDFGALLGLPLERKVAYEQEEIRTIEGGGLAVFRLTIENQKEFIAPFDLGVLSNLGFEINLTNTMRFFTEIGIDLTFNGSQDVNRFLFSQGASLGVFYQLND